MKKPLFKKALIFFAHIFWVTTKMLVDIVSLYMTLAPTCQRNTPELL